MPHNERLEFLGDAVLELVVSDLLFNRHPDVSEGELTKMRSLIVCEPTLARVARSLNLGHYLALGRGEELAGGRERPALLADAFEAMIGAVYRDQGFAVAYRLISKLLAEAIAACEQGQLNYDFKTSLQELLQARGLGDQLSYHVVAERGPDHAKEFEVAIKVGGRWISRASGKSKKAAEQKAAQQALERFQCESLSLE